MSPAYGGTGVANNAANTLTFTGAYSLSLTLTGNTSLTLPTSGTLVNSAVTSLSSLETVGNDGAGGLSIAATHSSGTIRFYSGGTTLRWTIATNGELQTGTPTLTNTGLLVGNGYLYIFSSGTGSNDIVRFYNASGQVGAINTSGTATSYATSSDARLKNDLGIATSTEVLQRSVVHDGSWKSDGTLDRFLVAQEAAAIKPRAVTVGTDDRDASGRLIRPWMLDYSKYVPDLIVGWQNHETRLAALEERMQ